MKAMFKTLCGASQLREIAGRKEVYTMFNGLIDLGIERIVEVPPPIWRIRLLMPIPMSLTASVSVDATCHEPETREFRLESWGGPDSVPLYVEMPK